jgi:hypothetical protein
MKKSYLRKIISEHQKWLDNDGGERADLREADLRGATLREANLRWANLSGANLSGATLREANLRWANLSGANLSGATLREADLRGADLLGADLREADLSGADLLGADLREANLSGANLRWADLREANPRWANDAPLQMQVESWLVYIQSGYMRIGCERHRVEDWRSFDDDTIHRMDPEHALEFWRANRDWLLAACDAQMATIREDEK